MGRGGLVLNHRYRAEARQDNSARWLSPGRIPCRGLGRFRDEPPRVRRHIPLILQLPHYLHAASSSMQRIPDLEKHSFPVLPPLMISKTQLLNSFAIQKSFSGQVALPLSGSAVFEPVQLDRQSRQRAVEVQVIFPERMLATELKPGETPGTERLPKLLFLFSLFLAKPPRVARRIHGLDHRELVGEGKLRWLTPRPLSLGDDLLNGCAVVPHRSFGRAGQGRRLASPKSSGLGGCPRVCPGVQAEA